MVPKVNAEAVLTAAKERGGLYIALMSLHGLVRYDNIELGKDEDTGGQVRYVVDLAEALSKQEGVRKVDLLTRKITDPRVDEEYGKEITEINDKFRIVRVGCGPEEEYIRKEKLWSHVYECADNVIGFFTEQNDYPDVVHGHYADAGKVMAYVSRILHVPLLFTGHSLGYEKIKNYREKDWSDEEIEEHFTMAERIEGEELAFECSEAIVCSTNEEKEMQWANYDSYEMEKIECIPPGVDIMNRREIDFSSMDECPLAQSINRQLRYPDKPLIVLLARADQKKNAISLVRAYGQSTILQEKANLVLVCGRREKIEELNDHAKEVMLELFEAIDDYDLYGSVAYPKTHKSDEVAWLYDYAARSRGIFVNCALHEPFGLTVLEAAVAGLPTVATKEGGPSDSMKVLRHGELVDPLSVDEIRAACEKLITDTKYWEQCSANGRDRVKYYSWDQHCKTFLELCNRVIDSLDWQPVKAMKPVDIRSQQLVVTNIDSMLNVDDEALSQLKSFVDDSRDAVTFGVATGRSMDLAVPVMRDHSLPKAKFLITDVGTRIHIDEDEIEGWKEIMSWKWDREAVLDFMDSIEGVALQPRSVQSEFKLSYFTSAKAPPKPELLSMMRSRGIHVNVILSASKYMDIVPLAASKGFAIRHIAMRAGLPFNQILAAGNSGNDADMVRGSVLGVVVGNHLPELDALQGAKDVYFAGEPLAWGVLEGINYYMDHKKIQHVGTPRQRPARKALPEDRKAAKRTVGRYRAFDRNAHLY
eukprot:Clim_evm74s147 gene=Clim_evmTU74s147